MMTAGSMKEMLLENTLVDSFGRVHDYLRISMTDHCNFRCTYCMPEGSNDFTTPSHLMTPDEILQIAKVFVARGVKKIRLTGGEPLVRKEAREIIRNLAELNVSLTITTNASKVDEFIDDFKAAGIDSINVSLDTFNKDLFLKITRRNDFDKVMNNIMLLINQGFHVKMNVVVMHGINVEELCDFVEFTRNHAVHVRFIEFMPFAGNGWQRDKVVSYEEMLEVVSKKYQCEKLEDEKHSTAKKYQVPGFAGTFAFINTITMPFCGDCNRIRLTADGKMKNCLFSKGEMDLLSALRRGDDINELVLSSLKDKKARTGGQDFSLPIENRSMVAIGG
jgi:molybdenum cofactor biosynthesis protein A